MKKLFSIVLIASVLMGCKSWDATQIHPESDPIQPKLPALEKSISDYVSAEVVSSEDEMTIFTKEVENNLTDPYGSKYGYITLSAKQIEFKRNPGLIIANGTLFFLPSLFGLPIQLYELKMDVTVRILDSGRKLVGKYNAICDDKIKTTLYNGNNYEGGDAIRKIHADCLKNALQDIRSQIQNDNQRLTKKLKEEGTIQ